MPASATEDIISFHKSLVNVARERPEYQDGQESALYGYSEGVEHGMEVLIASGYQRVEYARTVDDLKALPAGASIFDNAAVFTVNAASPCTIRTWVAPGGSWFPETEDAATKHLPALVLRPAAATTAPGEPKAIEAAESAQ